MTRPDFKFNPPAWTGDPKTIAELWRLWKDGQSAYCLLQNHPTRQAEIRCYAIGELRESRAENDPLTLFALADEWKAAFAAKGWEPDPMARALTHLSTADIRSPFDEPGSSN